MEWMRSVELPQADRFILDGELTTLEHLTAQIRRAEKMLARVGSRDPRVERLQTIPGIGPFFAMLLVSEIDEIGRSRGPAKLHAYAGLVPSTHSSGGRTYHGRIIKTSNKYLRWAMVEAVWPAIRKDPDVYRYYRRLARRKGANTAKVATARRLLSIVYRVWKEERSYIPPAEHRPSAGFVSA
jgi:transposase